MRAITLEGATGPEVEAILQRLAAEDALGQLLRREGRMAHLATEAGDVKLDWVDGVERALQTPEALRAAEAEGADIVGRGLRHVIWSGMGGSVQTVHTLKRMGYLDHPALAVHPLDSTDPAALNRVLRAIGAPGGARLEERLAHTLMIGVSMGMTSEEPITHLTWFDELLQERRIPDPGSHIEVMTLPGSYLDEFARPRGSRMVPIQLDGENHTPGRMSAPATRVFLRPVALMLAAAGVTGGLQTILQRGQALYGLSHTLADEARRQLTLQDPFLRLAAWLSLRADRAAGGAGATAGEAGPAAAGAPKLLVTISPGWEGFLPWLEQLVEESLGKDGKGFLVFYGQSAAAYGEDCAALRIAVEGYDAPPTLVPPHGARPWPSLTLHVPAPPQPLSRLPSELAGLGELTGLFLGMKKTVAAYGYLQDIVFAGQPAVEAYKRYARELREAPAPREGQGAPGQAGAPPGQALPATPSSPGRVQGPQGIVMDYSSLLRRGLLDESSLQALARRQGGQVTSPADVLGAILAAAREAGTLRYLDFTWNGELDEGLRALFERHRQRLANQTLRIPAKIRTGPSDYHSTEQSETDGPPELVSLRLVAERHEPVEAGRYDDTFLLAQARGTWQAMEDAGRWIVFLTVPAADEPAIEALDRLLEATAERLA